MRKEVETALSSSVLQWSHVPPVESDRISGVLGEEEVSGDRGEG